MTPLATTPARLRGPSPAPAVHTPARAVPPQRTTALRPLRHESFLARAFATWASAGGCDR